MGSPSGRNVSYRFAVAPMMDCTDRHCRFLHRQITGHALLYTEMIHANAIVHGNTGQLLEHDPIEYPLALQLGGSDPELLYRAAAIGARCGFSEINLNAGCPSPRVQSGNFGAVLMTMPDVAAECVSAMIEGASGTEVTVKCRIGVDDHNPEIVLPAFLETMASRGVRRVVIHARKALLKGLSPRQNRTVPPLDYGLAQRMTVAFPELKICLNGGIESMDQAGTALASGFDGVMVGRGAYRKPMEMLADVDRKIFGHDLTVTVEEVVHAMLPYIDMESQKGVKPFSITRHMLGLYAGRSGAGFWRKALSDRRSINTKGSGYIEEIMDIVTSRAAA